MQIATGAQNKYSCKTKIGNWSEDQELQEARVKDYIFRRDTGQLLVSRLREQLGRSIQPVTLSENKDGYIHFGNTVMIYSAMTEGVLSTDTSDISNSGGFNVTTSTLIKAAVTRNVFTIEPYTKDDHAGDILKLGQQIRLRYHDTSNNTALYLHSQPISMWSSSKKTRNQEVIISPSSGYETAWKVQFRDASNRLEMEGEPVPANAEVIITHCLTGQALASDKVPYVNDYGNEFEVCCKSFLGQGKKHGLYAESQGQLTADVPYKTETRPNHWALLTSSPKEDESASVSVDPKQAASVLSIISKNDK